MHITPSPLSKEERTVPMPVLGQMETDAQEFKNIIYRDIIENGLPIEYFSPTVSIRFRQEDWVFPLDNLKLLELSRFSLDSGDALVHPGNVHALNLAKTPLLIPDVNGRLFTASHAAASMLLKEYFDAHRRYIEIQNLLFKTIDEFPLGSDYNDRVRLWKTVYNTEDFYRDMVHVKL